MRRYGMEGADLRRTKPSREELVLFVSLLLQLKGASPRGSNFSVARSKSR